MIFKSCTKQHSRCHENKKKKDYYAESDSRAPDNSKALFTDSYKKKEDFVDINDKESEVVVIDMSNKKRKPEEDGDDNEVLGEAHHDDVEEFFRGANETDFAENVKVIQKHYNSKGVKKDEDALFETLATQFRDALSTQNVPSATAVETDAKTSDSDIKLPPRSKRSFASHTRVINDETIVIENDGIFKVDYKSLEGYEANNPRPVRFTPSTAPSLATPNTVGLNSNIDGSCFIDATFELLWHCVLPWVASSIFNKNAIGMSSNNFDKILLRTYELHSSGTLEDRLEASKEIRNFVWSIPGYERSVWDDCSKLFNLFLDNLSPAVRSFCSFSEVVRFKQCTVDEFHNEYAVSRIPYFSFTCSFDKLLYRKAIINCRRCIQEGKVDEDGVPGRLLSET